MARPFSDKVAEALLVRCHRNCCICHKFCGTKMEIHHIDPDGPSTEDNGIPLCFDCHAEVRAYDREHPKGRRFTPSELRKHRDQWFEMCAASPFAPNHRLSHEPITYAALKKGVDKVKRKRRDRDRSLQEYVDNRIFIPGRRPVRSRRANKSSYMSSLADIPVFMPNFTSWVSPPHMHGTKSAYVTSMPPCQGRISQFAELVSEVEEKWRDGYLRSVLGANNWTIAEENQFTYGCGGDNLVEELKNHERATIGAILQGNFGEHFNRTFFLVLYGYRKGRWVKDIAVDFYLSCIPVRWDWFQEIYDALRHFGIEIEIAHFAIRNLPLLTWSPARMERIKLKINGGIRREGVGALEEDREYDSYTGLIIANDQLRNIDYQLTIESDESSRTDKYMLSAYRDFDCPVSVLDESVISITNPVPTCSEVESAKTLDVNVPCVKMMCFDAYGGAIYGLTVHSMGLSI